MAPTKPNGAMEAYKLTLTTEEFAEVERLESYSVPMQIMVLRVEQMRHERKVPPVWRNRVATFITAAGGAAVGVASENADGLLSLLTFLTGG